MDGIDTIEKITQNVIDDTFAVNARGSISGQITYGASKATLEALTRSIALEVENMVLP